MTGCERCNTVNTAKRHAYIVLFKGDDSDFAWNQNIEITLETEMDLTGFRAKFSFVDFTQEFTDITSKKLLLVFPASATSSFPLGAADASIVLYDSDGKARTIANRIHMIVTKCVDEAYANEDPQAITVSISGSMEREQADWTETDTQSPSYIRNKPEIPSIDTTLTQSGDAADAKTVGDALRGGFTPWEFRGLPDGYNNLRIDYSDGSGGLVRGWYVQFSVGTEHDYLAYSSGTEYAESIELEYVSPESKVGESFSATRHLITPTKTSQLMNDGSNGVPFAVVSQIPAPVDISVKLDSEAVAADWSEAPPDIYQEGDVVTYNGRTWRHRSTSTNQDPPSSSNADWQQMFIYDWKQDRLTFDNSPMQGSDNPVKSGGVYTALQDKVSTNALAGQTYDFSRNYDIIKATAAIAAALGATVTNNPTANQGGN